MTMTSTEILTIILSSVSLLVSVIASIAAYKSYLVGKQQLRLSSINEFQKILIDINKELIRDPSLWAMYDDRPFGKSSPKDSSSDAKIEALIYLKLNLFELVHHFFNSQIGLSEREKHAWHAWDKFIKYTITHSSMIQKVLGDQSVDQLFSQEFMEYIKQEAIVKVDKPSMQKDATA